MKSRLVRLGVLLAAVLGLMATSTPAEATATVKTVTFTGTAEVTGGLGYPCAPATTTDPTAKCPVVGTGNHQPFTFASDTCVKLSVGKAKTGLDNCTITASGTVWGWCGLSSGLGTASLTNVGPVAGGATTKPTLLTADFHFVGVGGELIITGGSGTTVDPTVTMTQPEALVGLHDAKVTAPDPGGTSLEAVVTAVPVPGLPGAPSCSTKTGTDFIIVGEAVIEDI